MNLKLWTRVVAKCNLIDEDEGYQVARPGDLGVVVEAGQFPTVRFDRTGFVTMVDPIDEIAVSAQRVAWC